MDALRRRAAMLAAVRGFFAERSVLEVETPILSAAAVSDPHLESLTTRIAGRPAASYLCTSPEYAMKRLLAAGSGDIYQIGKVFRDEEYGRWHNPEFTLIEWYRLGFDDAALMTEVEALLGSVLSPYRRLEPAERLSYSDALLRHAGVDAGRASGGDLLAAARDSRHRLPCRARSRRHARPVDGARGRTPAWDSSGPVSSAIIRPRRRAGASEAGAARGRGALRALSGRNRIGERLS